MGLIRRAFGFRSPAAVEVAFKTLVRPLLEYCCPVWNPYLVSHVKSIEAIQRRATKLICGSDLSYEQRLDKLKWPTLELRRKFLSLVQVYKIIFGLCDIDAAKYFDIVRESRTRSNHKFKLRPNYARTNYFKFSFFNRYINDWNSLPSDVLEAQSLSLFKKKLLNHLMS